MPAIALRASTLCASETLTVVRHDDIPRCRRRCGAGQAAASDIKQGMA